jgi:hypothetical protein
MVQDPIVGQTQTSSHAHQNNQTLGDGSQFATAVQLNLRVLISNQRLVKSFSLVVFGVKVLDGLEVEEGVEGLLIVA